MKSKDCSVLHEKAQENGIPRANHKGKRPTRIWRNQDKKVIWHLSIDDMEACVKIVSNGKARFQGQKRQKNRPWLIHNYFSK